MSKHTPGPWVVWDDAEDGCLCATYEIAHPMAKQSISISQAFQQHKANARLIAAAPDLADVAHMVLTTATVYTPLELVQAATEALRKAGEIPGEVGG